LQELESFAYLRSLKSLIDLEDHYLEFNVRVFNGAPSELSIDPEFKGFILFDKPASSRCPVPT